MFGADGQEADLVVVVAGRVFGPGAELGAGPLEAVVGVALRARGERGELRVVLGVRGGDQHGGGGGEAEDGALQGGQALGVDVLDDLHQHGRVQSGQPVVAVSQRGLEDGQAFALPVGHSVQVQVPGGELQGPGGHVDGDDLCYAVFGEQGPGQHA